MGTAEGAKKAREKLNKKYTEEEIRKFRSRGGSVTGVPKGFAADRKKASMAGKLGGSIKKNKSRINRGV